nr:magnesium transporter [Salinarchaeum sp. Harcht-Bsk1]
MSDPSPNRVDTWSVGHIVRTMAPLLLVLSVLELGSGLVLESLQSTYLGNPTLLVLVPVMIGMGGNLGAIMAARLSTQLHLGTISFDPREPQLRAGILAIMGLAATVFTVLAIVAYGLGHLLGSPMALSDLLTISLVSGLSLAAIAVSLGIAATYVSYRRGYDPDDVTVPVVTNVCDILGVLILSVVAIVVL